MAKFCGMIGFVETVETVPGVHEEVVTEKRYYGDVLANNIVNQSSDKVNEDINISNRISILSNAYADNHLHQMRYVEFMGAKWGISKVDVQRPRLILTVGGVYNG